MIREIRTALWDDRFLYGVLSLYALAVLVLTVAAGAPHKFSPLIYFGRWGNGSLLIIGFTAANLAARSIRAEKPVDDMRERFSALATPQTFASLIMLVALSIMYGLFTSAKTTLPDVVPFFADPFLANLDARLHGQDPWRRLQWLEPYTDQISFLYVNVWQLCLVVFCIVATVATRFRHVRPQFLWTLLLSWIVLGNIVALAGLSVGPILYENLTGDPRFADLVGHLEDSGARAFAAVAYRDVLWEAYLTQSVGVGTGISAFPSMHLASATLFALFARHIHPLLGWIFAIFCSLILMGSVHLGWHYAVDGYFSIAATIGIWAAVGWVLRRNAKSEPALNAPTGAVTPN